jgi:hypothetical protein
LANVRIGWLMEAMLAIKDQLNKNRAICMSVKFDPEVTWDGREALG